MAVDLTGARILLDPGHSEGRPGARGGPPDYPREEELNALQAARVETILAGYGAHVEVHDPPEDDLVEIGSRARSHHVFLSLHHNACDHVDHHTFCAVQRRSASVGSIDLAEAIAAEVGRALGLPLRHDPGSRPGVVHQGLAVLRAAELTDCWACVLVESYFLDAYGDAEVCQARSLAAAEAIAEATGRWLAPLLRAS